VEQSKTWDNVYNSYSGRFCIKGSGHGFITKGDPRFNGGIANIDASNVCCGCNPSSLASLAYSALFAHPGSGVRSYSFEAKLNTLTFTCHSPFYRNPTLHNPNTMVISGIADTVFCPESGSRVKGTVNFSYTFIDKGSVRKHDQFCILTIPQFGQPLELTHFSGIITQNEGDILISPY
jgi:hypothetical protein